MRVDVNDVILTIHSSEIGLETINLMLAVAVNYEICDVTLALERENTKLGLHFKKTRTSVFVEEWVKFWMKPFKVEYELDFERPENGKKLVFDCSLVV
ncbi:MAG: hypothetical protein HKN33_11165 [Pyrinomonadaceae bacterium]|nr:hypothetical protein [Pyrinomonadaceae bacterium]